MKVVEEGGEIKLFGFQKGAEGFVRVGTGKRPEEWEDYLYVLAHAGTGAGKSLAGGLRAMMYMLAWRDSLGIICTPTYDTFNESTLPAFKRALEMGGLLEGRDYDYVTTRREIILRHNGAWAVVKSAEHPERISGMSAAWFWFDEAGQCDDERGFEAFLNLQKRLRQPGYPHQGWITTTPSGFDWLYGIFFAEELSDDDYEYIFRETKHDLGEKEVGRYLRFAASTRDNPHGGEEHYLQLVRTHGGSASARARQDLLGEFTLLEGLTYDTWEPGHHLKGPAGWPARPQVVAAGIDFGTRNPSAIIVGGVDDEEREYLVDEFYRAHVDEFSLARVARDLMVKHRIRVFFADSGDPRWIRALRMEGLPVVNANKRRKSTGRMHSSGFALCEWALNRRGQHGEQMFFVDPRLVNFRREIERYVRLDEGPDRNPAERPKQYADHAMDAWRYLQMGLADRGWLRAPDPKAELRRLRRNAITSMPIKMMG